VRAESNLDFNSLRKDEYIDLRAEETEIFHVTERFDAEGNYQIERISLTPEANRPGALRLSHKTVFDSDGHRFYDERGVLKRNLPITSLDEETLAALTGAWEASEGFPASELALPTSAQIEELEENGLTIDVLENGDIFMSADNQSIFLRASEPQSLRANYSNH